MFWIADTVQAQPTVVYVREAAGGMSEFTKILISATVGALVGIVSNIAMEYIMPRISRKNLLKVVTDQLVSELIVNYHKVESGIGVVPMCGLKHLLITATEKRESLAIFWLDCLDSIGGTRLYPSHPLAVFEESFHLLQMATSSALSHTIIGMLRLRTPLCLPLV